VRLTVPPIVWAPVVALVLVAVSSAPVAATPDPVDPGVQIDPTAPSTPSTTDFSTSTTTPTTTTTTDPATSTSTPTATTTTSTSTSTTTSTTTTTTTTTATTSTTSTTVAQPIVDDVAGAALNVIAYPGQLGHILATIRYLESGGRYDAPPNRGRASGAYQYITSTWNNHAGYSHAYLAPPWVQDERAAADVLAILDRFGNDVSMVPIIWYFPAAVADPLLLDTVPKPQFGNVLTIREYQARWLQVFAFISGGPIPPSTFGVPPGLEALSGMPPLLPPPTDDGPLSLAFPVLGPVTIGDDVSDSVVIFGLTMQPVLAAADGVVTAVQPSDPVSGDVRVMITDERGVTYRYSGLNDDTPGTDDGDAPLRLRVSTIVEVGATVRAGQIIGFIGNSDPVPTGGETFLADDTPVWPHLRFGITGANGEVLDAYGPLIDAVFRQSCSVGIGQWSTNSSSDATGIDRTIAMPADGGGGWSILPSGAVHAVGEAALVYPTEGCGWAPEEPYGPGALGSADVPEGFDDPIVLPIALWIAALKDGGEVRLGAPLRRG
jgi:murein DD-endopeptidase MepM/ murein hydrolase activator NlpD